MGFQGGHGLFAAGEKGRIPGGEGQGHIQHGGGGALVHVQGLGHVADAGGARGTAAVVAAEFHRAGVADFAEDGFEQGGFPRAVAANDGGQLPAVGVEADIVHQQGVAGFDSDMLNLQAVQAAAAHAPSPPFAPESPSSRDRL